MLVAVAGHCGLLKMVVVVTDFIRVTFYHCRYAIIKCYWYWAGCSGGCDDCMVLTVIIW